MTKKEATEAVRAAKTRLKVTWEQLAEAYGGHRGGSRREIV